MADAQLHSSNAGERGIPARISVTGRETGETAALQRSASLLRGGGVEAGEAGAVEEALALLHLFRDGLGCGQGRAVLGAGADQEVVRLFGVVRGADLNDPAGLRVAMRIILHSGDTGLLRMGLFGARLLPAARRGRRRSGGNTLGRRLFL